MILNVLTILILFVLVRLLLRAELKDTAKSAVIALVAFCTVFVALSMGSGSLDEKRYDAGYDDGYAVGFNTACEIRSTLIAGDWDDPSYSKGYAAGIDVGIKDCNAQRGQ